MNKLLVALGCGAALVTAAIVFAAPSRGTGPEPIRYGRDICDRCRMHFAAPGFAAERRDAKGAVHKYDDLGCMLIAASRDASGETFVEDHGGNGWTPLLEATLVSGGALRTPMNYGVVAFRDRSAAVTFARENGAAVVTLEELLRDPRRFDGGHDQEAHR